jgi:iron complex transport system permease protein
MRRWSGVLFGMLFLVVSIFLGTLLGPAGLTPAELWQALTEPEQAGPARSILLSLRLPRVTTGVLVGASLAVSGALFQALLRNPLAEPYLLGVSSGAGLGAVAAITLGLTHGPAGLAVAALAGGLLAIVIVFRVAQVVGRLDTRVLILAGVVVSAFFGACIMLLLTLSRGDALRSAVLWTMGSLSGVSWEMAGVLAAYTLPAIFVALLLARDLNALAIGEETAAHLGTRVEATKRLSYLLASLLAATAVSVAGVIGFVGLVVPHAVRLLWGADHRRLLPTCVFVGAGVLVLADTLARTVAAPLELPVGVITAIVGVPAFLALLRKTAR